MLVLLEIELIAHAKPSLARVLKGQTRLGESRCFVDVAMRGYSMAEWAGLSYRPWRRRDSEHREARNVEVGVLERGETFWIRRTLFSPACLGKGVQGYRKWLYRLKIVTQKKDTVLLKYAERVFGIKLRVCTTMIALKNSRKT